MTNESTQETGSVLLLHSTERKDDCHTLRTTSPLVSALTEESSSTYYTYAHGHCSHTATRIHPIHSFGVSAGTPVCLIIVISGFSAV